MKKCINIIFVLFSFCLLSSNATFANAGERPPQYVLLAFDGSLNLDMWNETLKFAKVNNIKFSYFISGVYFLLDSNRMDYVEPTFGPGKSAIGFAGDSKKNLVTRVAFVNRAYDEGHTIGSHANGHFDGSSWALPQWELEFEEFTHLIFNVFTQNGLNQGPHTNPYHFTSEQIVGFRAPQLGTNQDMYQALQKRSFAFDTSQTSSMDYWPKKRGSLWNFPLSELRIFETGKQTISMDYNFYFNQSGARPDLANAEKYRMQMLKTYLGYFYTNYYGNRAPVHIGHHFSKWNGGAYWLALEDFVKTVCVLPEVKCVSYQSLLNYMNTLTKAQIDAFQAGHFSKLPPPPFAQKMIAGTTPLDVSFIMDKLKSNEIELSIKGIHASRFLKNPLYVWFLEGKEFMKGPQKKIPLSVIPKMKKASRLSAILKYNDQELLKTSHMIDSTDRENFIFFKEDLEKRGMLGDLPDAHRD